MDGGNQTEGPLWSLYFQLKRNREKRTVTKQGSRSKGWGLRERGGCGESEKTPSYPPQVPMRAGPDGIKENIDGDISNEAN